MSELLKVLRDAYPVSLTTPAPEKRDSRQLAFRASGPHSMKPTCQGLGRVGNHLGLLGKVLGV